MMVSTHCPRWTCALVVTAAAAFILATASSAQAQAQATGSSPSLQAKPLPAAGWHGAPIQRPLPARDPVGTTTTTARGHAMSVGAGFGRPSGSPEVRALQRILRSLGYACGPVDGLFGTRTQASLQWFQIKHGLRPTGSGDAETLRILHLRDRAGGPQEAGPRAEAPASSRAPTRPASAPRVHPAPPPSHAPANAPRPHPAATPSHGAPAPQRGGQGLGAVPIALLLAAAVALVSLLLTVRWRRSWRTRASDATARLARRLRSATALLRHTKAPPAQPRTGPGPS
jgi:peptidoglycan hydrolase-like protein with peptidoglycan-binding domain